MCRRNIDYTIVGSGGMRVNKCMWYKQYTVDKIDANSVGYG